MEGVSKEFFTKGDPKWLEMRKGFITATDMPSLFGLNQYSSPAKVLESKHTPSFVDNVFTRMGKILEPAVAEATHLALRRPVSLYGDGANLIYFSKELRMSATPDAYIGESQDNPDEILELKSTSLRKLKHWMHEYPLHYIIQLAVQCLLLGVHKGKLAILSPQYPDMPILILDYVLTDTVANLMKDEVSRFWDTSSVEDKVCKYRTSSRNKELMTAELITNTSINTSIGLEEVTFDPVEW